MAALILLGGALGHMLRLLVLTLVRCAAGRALRTTSSDILWGATNENLFNAAKAVATAVDDKSGGTGALGRLESTEPWAPIEAVVEHPTDGFGAEVSDVYTIRVRFGQERGEICDAVGRGEMCSVYIYESVERGLDLALPMCAGGRTLLEVAVMAAQGDCVAALLQSGVDPDPHTAAALLRTAAINCDARSTLELFLHGGARIPGELEWTKYGCSMS
jgi:hypothetical protein